MARKNRTPEKMPVEKKSVSCCRRKTSEVRCDLKVCKEANESIEGVCISA